MAMIENGIIFSDQTKKSAEEKENLIVLAPLYDTVQPS
jgi:hypothetical protein